MGRYFLSLTSPAPVPKFTKRTCCWNFIAGLCFSVQLSAQLPIWNAADQKLQMRNGAAITFDTVSKIADEDRIPQWTIDWYQLRYLASLRGGTSGGGPPPPPAEGSFAVVTNGYYITNWGTSETWNYDVSGGTNTVARLKDITGSASGTAGQMAKFGSANTVTNSGISVDSSTNLTGRGATWAGLHTFDLGALNGTTAPAVYLRNSTAATPSQKQVSPNLIFNTHSWDSNAAGDVQVTWSVYNDPQVDTNGFGFLTFRQFKIGTLSANRYPLRLFGGSSVIIGDDGTLLSDTNNGFLYVSSMTNTPTGTPTSFSGKVPIVYDGNANKLYAYNAAAWHAVGEAGGASDGLTNTPNELISDWRMNSRPTAEAWRLGYRTENRQIRTMTSGNNNSLAMLFAKNKLYLLSAASGSGIGKVTRFDDLENLTSSTTATFPDDGHHVGPTDMIYVPEADRFYVSFANSTSNILWVSEVDPDDLSHVDVITETGGDPLAYPFSLAASTTNLFVGCITSSATNAYVAKYRMSDWVLSQTISVTNANQALTMNRFDGTNLYAVGGSASGSWVSKINPNTLAVTTTNYDNPFFYYFTTVGDNLWIVGPMTNTWLQVAKGDLSIKNAFYDPSANAGSSYYNVFFDGRYLYGAGQFQPTFITRMDPQTYERYQYTFEDGFVYDDMTCIASDGARLFMGLLTSPAKVIRIAAPALDFVALGRSGGPVYITADGNATFAGNVQTGNPSGGTAQPWRFGDYKTGLTISANLTNAPVININGQKYYLMVANETPP